MNGNLDKEKAQRLIEQTVSEIECLESRISEKMEKGRKLKEECVDPQFCSQQGRIMQEMFMLRNEIESLRNRITQLKQEKIIYEQYTKL